MYKCETPKADSDLKELKKNLFFEHPFFELPEKLWIFGNAYVFKVQNTKEDELGRIRLAETWETPNEEVLRKILNFLAQWERPKD